MQADDKYGGNVKRVRDASRLALVFDSPVDLVDAIDVLTKENDLFHVCEVENRFKKPAPMGKILILRLICSQ